MIRCEDFVGKVIQSFSLYENGPCGPEIQIEFTDGTAFNSCLKTVVTIEARLLRNAGGQTGVLKELRTPVDQSR